MGREPITETICGLTVTSSPLPFARAQELLPDIANLFSLIIKEMGGISDLKGTDDIVKLAPILGSVAGFLVGGNLERLAPKILAATEVIMADNRGDKLKYKLDTEKDRISVFDEHPEAYLMILLFAGRVTFARFFPASVLTAGEVKAA